MMVLFAILANIFLVFSAIGFGTLIQPFFPKAFSALDRVVVTLLGGLGLLGTILFCIGQVWFSGLAIVSVLITGILIGVASIARGGKPIWSLFGSFRMPFLPAAIVVVVLLITAVGGVIRPYGDTNNDSIAYHYLGPKVWLREAVIRPVPDEVPTYFPVVVETQYAALMFLGGERAPGIFAVVSLAVILLSAASLAMLLGLNSSEAWWVAALIAAMPAVYEGVYGGFLDAIFASFILVAARIAFEAEQLGEYAVFGIFCGFAMGTKYSGIVAWPPLIIGSLLVSVWAHHRSLAGTLKYLAAPCATAIAIASPFYLRNWILYGCPILPPPPVLLHFFSPPNPMSSEIHALANGFQVMDSGMGRGFAAFLLLPFNITFHTASFRGAGGIGLVPLALGPLGAIGRRRDGVAMGLLLFAVLETLAWFVTAQESRYAINLYAIAAIFGFLGWQYVVRLGSRTARALAVVLVAVSILYGMSIIISTRADDVHAALSSSFAAKRRLAKTLGTEAFDYINGEPSVKRVLILNSVVAPFFIDKPYVKPFGVWGERPVPGVADVQDVMAKLSSLHVTHIFDYKLDNGSFSLPEHPPSLTLVFERPDQRIYRVD